MRYEADMRTSRTLHATSIAALLVVIPGTVALGGSPDRVVWVSLEGAGELAQVDLGKGVLQRVDTRGGGPHNITVGPDGTVVAAL